MMLRNRTGARERRHTTQRHRSNVPAGAEQLFPLRDLPKYEALETLARRFPELDPSAAEAYLVLLRVSTDVLAAGETYLGRHGLSMGRLSVLMLLLRAEGNGVTPSALAQKSGVTRATMTGLVDGLEREGFVRREGSRNDRRSITVRLTATGERFLRGMLPAHFRRVAQLMGKLDARERRTLVALLDKVKGGLSSITDP